MTTPAALLAALLKEDPATPRLTWYDGPERVELSARVLDNWASKAANLLLEEADLGGGTVLLDLPAGHWRTLYWALAAWLRGATVRLASADDGSDRAGADVVVTADPAAAPGLDLTVLVTPAMLARSATGPVPSGWLDEAAELGSYGDFRGPDVLVSPAAPALVAGDHVWTYAELFADVPAERRRTHVDAGALDEVTTLRRTVDCWARLGSAVVTTGPDDEARRRLLASEGVA